jgi:hypothetical protein
MATCGFQMSGGLCGVPIVPQAESPTGYAHASGYGWLHWASPTPYRVSVEVFVPCAVCGKIRSENPAHIQFGGHKFTARIVERSCRS